MDILQMQRGIIYYEANIPRCMIFGLMNSICAQKDPTYIQTVTNGVSDSNPDPDPVGSVTFGRVRIRIHFRKR